jgi:hypothetical protein
MWPLFLMALMVVAADVSDFWGCRRGACTSKFIKNWWQPNVTRIGRHVHRHTPPPMTRTFLMWWRIKNRKSLSLWFWSQMYKRDLNSCKTRVARWDWYLWSGIKRCKRCGMTLWIDGYKNECINWNRCWDMVQSLEHRLTETWERGPH